MKMKMANIKSTPIHQQLNPTPTTNPAYRSGHDSDESDDDGLEDDLDMDTNGADLDSDNDLSSDDSNNNNNNTTRTATTKLSNNEIVIEDKDTENYGAESANNDETAMSFEDLGLCDELLAATEALGWKKPSIIQSQAIPIALSGRDIIGLAETGSGKTGAFAIPVIQALLANPQSHFALVLAPTREWAVILGFASLPLSAVCANSTRPRH